MRLSLKRMIVALAAVVLLGTGSVFASPPAPSPDSSAYFSGRASALLAEIQKETAGLRLHADTLGTFASYIEGSKQRSPGCRHEALALPFPFGSRRGVLMPALRSRPMSQVMGLAEKQTPIRSQEAQPPQEPRSSVSS